MSKEFPITISSWTLGDQCKFEDRVIAAKNAGYEGIGLRAETYVDALNEGLFDKDILAILDKHGMKVTEVEYIVQWAEEHRSYEQKYQKSALSPSVLYIPAGSALLFHLYHKSELHRSLCETPEAQNFESEFCCFPYGTPAVLHCIPRFAFSSQHKKTEAPMKY